jgi:hypothetical protein
MNFSGTYPIVFGMLRVLVITQKTPFDIGLATHAPELQISYSLSKCDEAKGSLSAYALLPAWLKFEFKNSQSSLLALV